VSCKAAVDALNSNGAVEIEIPNRPALYA
jgi:hypothetical protein